MPVPVYIQEKPRFRIDLRDVFYRLGENIRFFIFRALFKRNEYAYDELKRAGLFDKDSDYDGMIGVAVDDLCRLMAGQGHSGCSNRIVLDIFNKLRQYKPLTPITNNPDEWNEVSKEDDGKVLYQSRRDPSLFSTDGGDSYYCVDEIDTKAKVKKKIYHKSQKWEKKNG